MFSNPHLLVPVNFSAASSEALRQAVRDARHDNGRITLLHVLPGAPSELHGLDSIAYLHQAAHDASAPTKTLAASPQLAQKFDQFLAEVPNGDLSIAKLVRQGDVAKEVVRFSKEHDVRTIYLGASGRGGMMPFFPGIFQQVIREAVCRVMTIRPAQLAAVGG